jgi:hypothetical protein
MSLAGIKKVEDKISVGSTVENLKDSLEAGTHDDHLTTASPEVDISPIVQSFTDEVKAYLQVSDNNISKDDMLHSLQDLMRKYPVLKIADCKQELIHFLFNEINTQYPKLLQLNDIKELFT